MERLVDSYLKSLDIKVIHITASGKRENLGQTNFAPVFDTGNDHALHKRSIDLRLKTESREHDLGTLTLKYSAILENLSFEHKELPDITDMWRESLVRYREEN